MGRIISKVFFLRNFRIVVSIAAELEKRDVTRCVTALPASSPDAEIEDAFQKHAF